MGRHSRKSAEDQKRRAQELLASVGMQQDLDKLPSEISGGMQKRVGLARALALDPERAFEKPIRYPVDMEFRQAYDSDVTDAEWEYLEFFVPAVLPGGRPPKHTRREIINGICYAIRSGGAWKLLPHDLPP